MTEPLNLRDEIVDLLNGGQAHKELDEAVDGLPSEHRPTVPDSLPYSIWDLLEHIRLCQDDIIEFSTNPEYETGEWPDDYWPEPRDAVSDEEWNGSLQAVHTGLDRIIHLVQNEEKDLLTPFPHGNDQTLFREAMLIVDHRSYHIGQIIVIRRLLNEWNEEEGFTP